MAYDKVVDSTQLNADLTAVANAIRAKSGGSGQIAFPAEFVSEIGSISGGEDTLSKLLNNTLTSYESDDVVRVPASVFYQATSLESVNLPNCTTVGSGSFDSCTGLTSVTLPKVTFVGNAAFSECTGLTSITLSEAITVDMYAFNECTGLTSVTLPKVTFVGNGAFGCCTGLTGVTLPKATSVGKYAFQDAPIDKLALPKVTTLGGGYITTGNGAREIDLSANPTIVANAFNGDRNLTSLILRSSAPLTLANVNALSGTPIARNSGWIYVPSELVSTYKEATNWATYASQIVSLDEYPCT